MNEFESSWVALSEGRRAAGRLRVYPDHPLNFYVQYSLAGHREIVIEVISEDIAIFELPSFKNITLVCLSIPGGVRIGMTLFEADLARNFSLMCYDLAERSRVANSVKAAAGIFLLALDNWAELFKTRAQEGLTREEVLGLIGELLVVEALLVDSKVTPDTLIRGWRGPDGDARDIGFNGARLEVKTQHSTGALKLRISSLAQLDDRGDRVFVVLIRLSPAEAGRSLADLVQALQTRLEHIPMASLEFERKVALSRMSIDSALSHEKYSVDDRLVYAVSEAFPRLIPATVPLGVTAAQYEISGPSLDAFRTDWDLLLGVI